MPLNIRKPLSIALMIVSLAGASCQMDVVPTPAVDEPLDQWISLSPAVERRVLRLPHEQTMYEIVAYRLRKDLITTSLYYQNPPKRLEEWGAMNEGDIVINGAFFTEEFLPTGAFTYQGALMAGSSYEAARSATAAIADGTLSLFDTAEEPLPKRQWDHSFQSFPVLIHRSGEAGVTEESEKIARRTVLADDEAGNIYLLIVDRTPITLFDLTNVLLASDLPLDMAVNLDGGPSTALHTDLNGHHESILPLTALPIVLSFAERISD